MKAVIRGESPHFGGLVSLPDGRSQQIWVDFSRTGTDNTALVQLSTPCGPAMPSQYAEALRLNMRIPFVALVNGGGSGGTLQTNTGAAGTVYIEGASQAEGGGRIVIGNANLFKRMPTEFPPTLLFSDNLLGATLVITNGAWVNLTSNVIIGNLYMTADAQFNLNGYTCTVNTPQHPLDGTPTGPGTVKWRIPGTVFSIR